MSPEVTYRYLYSNYPFSFFFFFFNDTATTEIYTLSLHDALPTYVADGWPIGLYWAGDLLVKPWRLTLDQPLAYFYLNGAAYYLFGPTQIPMKILNAFVGAFSCRY